MSEDVWPGVFERAVSALRRKGVAAADAEDAVQEAISRAWAREVPAEDVNDMLRWVNTVAWRLVIDRRRRDMRLVYEVPETVGSDDPVMAAENKDLVERVQGSLALLSDSERAALSATETPVDRRESVRMAVRRHRARARLLALVEGVAAFVPIFRLRVKLGRRGLATAAAAAAGASAFAFVTPSMLPFQRPAEVVERPVARAVAVPPAVSAVSAMTSAVTKPQSASAAAPKADAYVKAEIQVPGAEPVNAQFRPRTEADHDFFLHLEGLDPIVIDLPPIRSLIPLDR